MNAGELWRKLISLIRRSKLHRELEEEMRLHLDLRTKKYQEAGLAEEEARFAAKRHFGNSLALRERSHDVWAFRWIEDFVQDVRYGLRTLSRSSGFATVAIAALALGIGANTLMFSVVNGVLLQPLAYQQSGRLVLAQTVQEQSGRESATSPPDFYTARRQNRSFESLAAFYQGPVNISGNPQAERVQRLIVSPEFFNVLRINPMLGRSFVPQDEQWGSHRVALLSHALWVRRYGSDPNIVERVITLDAEPYVVAGVLPPSFKSFQGGVFDICVPMSFAPGDNLNTHNNYFLTMVGRLKPGVSLRQAGADLAAIAQGIAAQYPENKGLTFQVKSLQEALVGDVKPTLWVLMGAVGFVLLIACANIANLLLARAAGRAREVAVRAALGARKTRLLRQWITESLLLSVVGGCLGLLLAYWGTRSVHLLSRRLLPRVDEIHLDSRILLFTFAASVLTGILFGLAPALHSLRLNFSDSLKEGTRPIGDLSGQRMRSAFVVTEVALSLMLLIGAGLMLKSMRRLLQVHIGFNPHNLISSFLNLPEGKYAHHHYDRALQYFDEAEAQLQRIPGVVAVGAISNLPLNGENWGKVLTLYDRPVPSDIDELPSMQYRVVSGDYFRALGIQILAGRAFNDHDNARSQKVVVVNRELERRFWNGGSALGKVISVNPPISLMPSVPAGYTGPDKFTIIGVADDVHYGTLESTPPPLVYALQSQGGEGAIGLHLVVRTAGDPVPLIPLIRQQLAQVDPDVPFSDVQPLTNLLSRQLAEPRLELILLGSFAGLAVILAVIGIYGVMAYSVAQRTREVGIRIALGAARIDVIRMLLGRGMLLVVIGVIAGMAAAVVLTRVMQHMLFAVSATDPAVFAAIPLLLTLVALLAGYIPARRATRIDPLHALRYE